MDTAQEKPPPGWGQWCHRCSLLLEEGAEESPVKGQHGLRVEPLLGLLEVVLLGAESPQHFHWVRLARELLHSLFPARRPALLGLGRVGWGPSSLMDNGVISLRWGCWGTQGPSVVPMVCVWCRTLCPLPQGLELPPASEAVGRRDDAGRKRGAEHGAGPVWGAPAVGPITAYMTRRKGL